MCPKAISTISGGGPSKRGGRTSCRGLTTVGQRLRFVHAGSPEPDAAALLISHGWPRPFADFAGLVGPLIAPSDYATESAPAAATDSESSPRGEAMYKDRALVFEPYFRGERRQTAGHAGLGLSIARTIVQAHGGQIGLADGSEGTSVSVTLPAIVDAAHRAARNPTGR